MGIFYNLFLLIFCSICYSICITNRTAISLQGGVFVVLLKIDFESDIPIYMQIKNAILQGIAKGDLSPGENLPSVRQLAEDIGINMHTVNKAYNLLKNDGFLTIDRRKGAIINDKISSPTEEYKVLLEENLKSTIAEAICKGVSEGEFLTTCNNIFNTYKEGTKK